MNSTILLLKQDIARIEAELNKNNHLAIVYSQYDREALPKLDSARNDLMKVLVSKYTDLDDAVKAENDLLNEFCKMV